MDPIIWETIMSIETEELREGRSVSQSDFNNGSNKEHRMTQAVKRYDIEFPSHDGVSTIHGLVWQPINSKPKGIVQLIHGMAEHIERYDDFAKYIARHGYLVCGYDHIGHGKSVESSEDLGHMPSKNGAEILVEDAQTLRMMMSSLFEDVPYFLFGHSMGSFVVRVLITKYGEGLAGAIICATGWIPEAVSVVGSRIAKLLARIKGDKASSKFVYSMAEGLYANAIENARTEFDWISYNEDNVDEYMADELNGFKFSLGGYISLIRLTGMASSLEAAKKIPKDLPLLFVAGSDDPVGANGRGVTEAVKLMQKADLQDIEVIIYGGMRHEILNEKESMKVYEDVYSWISKRDREAKEQ